MKKNDDTKTGLENLSRGSFVDQLKGGTGSETAAPGPSAATSYNAGNAFLLADSDHQGAASSPLRGYVYWRSTDTRRQISDFTDAEIQRRLDFLYNHSGVCRRLVNGCAQLCGILTPQPNTVDEDWNEESFDSFNFGAMSPEIFDAGGRFDFYGAQLVTNALRFRAGRSLGVLTESPTGRARLAFYDPYQISHKRANGANTLEERRNRNLVRGVELNQFSRHLAYYLRDAADPKKDPQRVDARSAIYFGKFDNHGQVHPLSILAGAVVNLIDVAETRSSWKAQIKSAGRRGEVIEQDPVQNHIHSSGGIAGSPVEVSVTQADGTDRTVELEAVYGAGPQIQKLSPGQRLKLITDDRPSSNNLEFDKLIVEDCSFFADLPPAALFAIAGLTGPGVRYVMEQIERWILIQHLWQARWTHRFYTYSTAKEIKAGRLREPVDPVSGEPVEWWRPNQCLWIGLPSLTIDKGKEGKLSITQLDAGLTTWADEWGTSGAFWKKKISNRVLEVGYAKLKAWQESKRLEELTEGELKLDASEVFKFAGLSGSSSGSADPADVDERLEDVEERTEEQDQEQEERDDADLSEQK